MKARGVFAALVMTWHVGMGISAYALAATIPVTFEPTPGCTPGQAQVDFVQPDVARIMLWEQCGSVTCWRRWLEIAGRKVGESRICEKASSSGGSPLVVP